MDIWTIVWYVIGIVFNSGVVSTFRLRAYAEGQEWLKSGRFAVVAVFVLCFIELLAVGRFEALQNYDAFRALVEQAWLMTGGAVGVHTAAKTVVRMAVK